MTAIPKQDSTLSLSIVNLAKHKLLTAQDLLPTQVLNPKTQVLNSKTQVLRPVWNLCNLPKDVPDEPLPAALLGRTYAKPGLTEIDRYHAKFGDVGIKYMKRCLPDLKVPHQYRCEVCIDGKIHKFGHKACAEGVRMEYLPGVCIHSDHSGPYARSLSGARYSQLYLDRGSGYLWAVRQKKKTEHYISTPRIFIDSWGLSGRKAQIFLTDGDPSVFDTAQTRELLEAEHVRHEYSAPYDSNTNPFIERARRTVFEGVCTALIRAGAPARFWGEAECHKVYTIKVLPTQDDPDKPGSFCSRKNLLKGSRRPVLLDRLMAFGTAATCYVPKEKRKGGKEPAQRRFFHGVILGYAEIMPAYRVWDLEARCIKLVSYNFTICHEGYYPFRDRTNWPPDSVNDPPSFSPLFGGVLTMPQWKLFGFDEEEQEEVLERSPDLLVTRPDPDMRLHPIVRPSELAPDPPVAQPPQPELSTLNFHVLGPDSKSGPHRHRDFWQSALDAQRNGGDDSKSPPVVNCVTLCPSQPSQPVPGVIGTPEENKGPGVAYFQLVPVPAAASVHPHRTGPKIQNHSFQTSPSGRGECLCPRILRSGGVGNFLLRLSPSPPRPPAPSIVATLPSAPDESPECSQSVAQAQTSERGPSPGAPNFPTSKFSDAQVSMPKSPSPEPLRITVNDSTRVVKYCGVLPHSGPGLPPGATPTRKNLFSSPHCQGPLDEKFYVPSDVSLSYFTKILPYQEPNLSDPLNKPMGIPPPKTLREARQSPWLGRVQNCHAKGV